MRGKAFLFGVLWVLSCGGAGIAIAASDPAPVEPARPEKPVISCDIVYEGIVPLRLPDFDQSALWKKTLGVQGIDRPRTVLHVADGGVIAIGESVPYDEKTGLAKPRLQMIRLAPDGKPMVQQDIEVKGLRSVTGAVLQKTRVVVLASTESGEMLLLSLDGKGALKDTKQVRLTGRSFAPESFVSLSSGGFIIAGSSKQGAQKAASRMPSTALIWVDADGSIRTVKDYLPGIETRPESLIKGSDGVLRITGRVMTEKDQWAGWILTVGTDGTLISQRPYTRGADATLRRVASLPDGGTVAIGDAIPAGEGDKAAWIIRTDASGNPVWQKFLTGKYSYAGVDVTVFDDGRIMTLWAATPTRFGGRRFARIVTFSPEGQILSDESVLDGSNTIPLRIMQEKDRRVLLGMVETGFARDKRDGELEYVTYDTSIMAMPPLPAYQDTCATAPDRVLDDLPLEQDGINR